MARKAGLCCLETKHTVSKLCCALNDFLAPFSASPSFFVCWNGLSVLAVGVCKHLVIACGNFFPASCSLRTICRIILHIFYCFKAWAPVLPAATRWFLNTFPILKGKSKWGWYCYNSALQWSCATDALLSSGWNWPFWPWIVIAQASRTSSQCSRKPKNLMGPHSMHQVIAYPVIWTDIYFLVSEYTSWHSPL